MSVRQTAAVLLTVVCLGLVIASQAFAQSAFSPEGMFARHHTQAKLLLSADAGKPGDTILAGVDLKMDSGWHTYWKNPGDAGSPTKVEWTLPSGISAGEIQWPLPEKLPPAEVTTYGYEDEVLLIVPLTLGTNLAPGTVNLSAKVSWLECKESCLPANQMVEARLAVGAESKISADASTIDSWKARIPRNSTSYLFQAAWEKAAVGDTRLLLIVHGGPDADKNVKYDSVDFYPAASDSFEIQADTEVVSAFSADVRLRKVVKKFSGDWPKEVGGTVVIESGKNRYGYDVTLPVAETTAPAGKIAATAGASPALPSLSLGQVLLYAFIGGLILNIMPCVLPVIALKVLGFVSEARSEPRRVRTLGLIYTAGVLVSFLGLAATVIGVKAAGHHAGWGMQFGSPIFVVGLATLVLLVALNLFGVFEVTLGGRALDTASELASKGGTAGAFFNGVLATTLATPCTAPFLAPALGFAFAQSAPVIVLVFLMVGLGLSAPYLVLSCQPGWLRFLPKPGAWMEKFKNAMGFPMLATVVWLFSVASSSYGKNVLWLGVFLVVVAFAAWVFGEFFQRGSKNRIAAAIVTLLLLAGGYIFALEKELDWRTPVSETSGAGESSGGIAWQPWTPEAVNAARAAGKPVLVDFTADWCLTCQVNRKTSIEIPSVRDKLKAINAVALMGDYTHFPDAITAELNRFERAGVPLVLVYPKAPETQPIVLPAFLTPQIVLDSLNGRPMVGNHQAMIWVGVATVLVAICFVYFIQRGRKTR